MPGETGANAAAVSPPLRGAVSRLATNLRHIPRPPADDPRNALASDDLLLVSDALERLDMSGELVAGDSGFDVAVLKTPEPMPAPEPVAQPRPERSRPPPLEKYNLTNMAIASLVVLGGGYLAEVMVQTCPSITEEQWRTMSTLMR